MISKEQLEDIAKRLPGESPGAELIAFERIAKQILKHGFTAEHAAAHPEWYANGQLIFAASVMLSTRDALLAAALPINWDEIWFRRLCEKPYAERLIIAGAFIAAEIDRLNYIAHDTTSDSNRKHPPFDQVGK